MYYTYHSPCIHNNNNNNNNNNKAIMLSSIELEKDHCTLSIIIWVPFLRGVRSPTLLCIILYVVSHDHGTWESLSLWHVLLHLHNAKTHIWIRMRESQFVLHIMCAFTIPGKSYKFDEYHSKILANSFLDFGWRNVLDWSYLNVT
jgi:hypothetical protein